VVVGIGVDLDVEAEEIGREARPYRAQDEERDTPPADDGRRFRDARHERRMVLRD
jgi:hypothetical protein